MENKPIWLKNIKFSEPKVLNKELEVDVLIVGGGLTGLSTAYHLRNSRLKVCVVEKNLIAHGVSARTTGKLTYLQDNIYTKLKEKASIYYKSQKEAIKLVEKIIKDNKINCDFEKVDSYIYTDKETGIDKIATEARILDKLNIKYQVHTNLPNNISCKYAISVSNTAIFHPVKYLNALKNIIVKNGILVYENSGVTSIKKQNDNYVCIVNNYRVTAKKVVIASHYPFFLIPYLIPIKTYIDKSYISANIVKENKFFSAITISKPIKSIRHHKDKSKNYLIYLNGSHNLCHKYDNKDNFNNLLKEINKYNLKPSFIWSNQDIMTEDNLPYIGYIDKNLLIGTGYNTWGMTNGSIAGKILSDLILCKENAYQHLFDPKRCKKLVNVLKYPLNMACNTKSIVENKIIKNKNWYINNVKFTKINGKNVAIYVDEDSKEHIVYNLCPHMKCSLIFNEIEKTWDCPCHGSRFDLDGKVIFGPSNKDIGFNN